MTFHRDLPSLEELISRLEAKVTGSRKPNEKDYLDAYDLMRINSHNINAVDDVIHLITLFSVLDENPPTDLSGTLWKGMLVIVGLVVSRYIDDEPQRRTHLNVIYLMLGTNLESDSDQANVEQFFSKVNLLSDSDDIRWLAANIELRFSVIGKRDYEEEIKIASDLAETARRFHPFVYLQACLLIGLINIEYSYFDKAFIYGQQALIIAHALGCTYYERPAVVYMSDFAINLANQAPINAIIQYWNTIQPPDGSTDHQNAVWYSSIWRKYYHAGQYDLAEECTRRAYEIFKARQHYQYISKMQASLAMVLVKQQRFKEAIGHSHQSFLVAHHHHYPIEAVSARHIEGWALSKAEALRPAIDTLIQSLTMALQLGSSNTKHKFLISIMGDLASALDSIPPPERDNQTIEFVISLIPVIFKAIQAINARNIEVEWLALSNKVG